MATLATYKVSAGNQNAEAAQGSVQLNAAPYVNDQLPRSWQSRLCHRRVLQWMVCSALTVIIALLIVIVVLTSIGFHRLRKLEYALNVKEEAGNVTKTDWHEAGTDEWLFNSTEPNDLPENATLLQTTDAPEGTSGASISVSPESLLITAILRNMAAAPSEQPPEPTTSEAWDLLQTEDLALPSESEVAMQDSEFLLPEAYEAPADGSSLTGGPAEVAQSPVNK